MTTNQFEENQSEEQQFNGLNPQQQVERIIASMAPSFMKSKSLDIARAEIERIVADPKTFLATADRTEIELSTSLDTNVRQVKLTQKRAARTQKALGTHTMRFGENMRHKVMWDDKTSQIQDRIEDIDHTLENIEVYEDMAPLDTDDIETAEMSDEDFNENIEAVSVQVFGPPAGEDDNERPEDHYKTKV